jgi:hypothetical protein
LKGDKGTWPDFDHALEIYRITDAVRKSRAHEQLSKATQLELNYPLI